MSSDIQKIKKTFNIRISKVCSNVCSALYVCVKFVCIFQCICKRNGKDKGVICAIDVCKIISEF